MLETAKRAVKHAAIRWLLWRESRGRQHDQSKFGGLPPQLWGCSEGLNGHLEIDGVDVQELTDAYGTPLHVVNEKELLKTYRTFLKSFEDVYPNVVLATSYKTNPVPYVLKTLHEAGSSAEVISHFELWLALNLGMSPDKIILNGPGKGDEALKLAVEKRVSMINIDGPFEIAKIARFAGEYGVKQRVGLRVTSSVGWSSQFGLSIASGAAQAAFEEMLTYAELEPTGLHLHLGTGIQDIQTYVQAVRELLDFSRQLYDRNGVRIDHFDLGGGFGVPTVRSMDIWDGRMQSLGYSERLAIPEYMPTPKDFARALAPLIEQFIKSSDGADRYPAIVFEPGRAITSSSQVLLLSVIGAKSGIDEKDFLIVDGGKNVTMPLGWETHQFFAANKMNIEPCRKYDVFGPLCHPGDIIVKNRMSPATEEGDILAVMDAGAYFIPNQMNFSNPRPPIVRVRNGEHSLVRQRETFEDIVRLDTM